MQLTELQTNAAIQAIVLKYAPNFHELTPQEKTSLGQSTYWWFRPIVSELPEDFEPCKLGESYWEHIKAVAESFLVGVIRRANPHHRRKSDDELKNALRLADVETQALLFLNLAQTGLAAARDHAKLQAIADSFDTMDLDFELQRLITLEG